MPLNADQLAAGANKTIQTYAKNNPIDQFTKDKPLTKWLVQNMQAVIYGNGIFNEKVRFSNQSNFQWYTGDDQVTYNKRDTTKLAPFQHYESHDGFSLNETELANNGIIMTDDRNAVATGAEKQQIINLLDENYTVLKNGFQDKLDEALHLDGTQDTKAVPGLLALISSTPASAAVVGGIDQSTNAWWQNTADLAINTGTAGTLVQKMEADWRRCITVGGMKPDGIFVGSAFLDAYRKDALDTINRQILVAGNRGTNMDASTTGIYFKGVELQWDPTLDALQGILGGGTDYSKYCYFLQSKSIRLRPNQGRWLVNRKPPRIYDRYTYYFGLTTDCGLTVNQRNNMAVLSIA